MSGKNDSMKLTDDASIIRQIVISHLLENIRKALQDKGNSKFEIDRLLKDSEIRINEAFLQLDLIDIISDKELNSEEVFSEHIRKIVNKILPLLEKNAGA